MHAIIGMHNNMSFWVGGSLIRIDSIIIFFFCLHLALRRWTNAVSLPLHLFWRINGTVILRPYKCHCILDWAGAWSVLRQFLCRQKLERIYKMQRCLVEWWLQNCSFHDSVSTSFNYFLTIFPFRCRRRGRCCSSNTNSKNIPKTLSSRKINFLFGFRTRRLWWRWWRRRRRHLPSNFCCVCKWCAPERFVLIGIALNGKWFSEKYDIMHNSNQKYNGKKCEIILFYIWFSLAVALCVLVNV